MDSYRQYFNVMPLFGMVFEVIAQLQKLLIDLSIGISSFRTTGSRVVRLGNIS